MGYYVELNTLLRPLEFELITLFSKEEQELYKKKFIEAGKITGEIK